MTIVGGSDKATEEGSVSIVPVIGATMEGPETCKYGKVGCPINSLKVAPRLLETGVSVTSIDEVCAGVNKDGNGHRMPAGMEPDGQGYGHHFLPAGIILNPEDSSSRAKKFAILVRLSARPAPQV